MTARWGREEVLIRVIGELTPQPRTGAELVFPKRRSKKWRPLGARHHVPSDPILLTLMRFLRDGKRTLMGLARHAAKTDLVILRLLERWDRLSAGARKAVTLTDLLKFSGVTPARFIAAIVGAAWETTDGAVIEALGKIYLPEDVEVAIRERLPRPPSSDAQMEQFRRVG